MADTFIFQRVEKKYLLTAEQREQLLSLISHRLTPDIHGVSTICSLYLDTPTFLLVRNSIQAERYKEKLRLRSYGIQQDDGKVFLEIKKKYKGVVYKRRISATLKQAMDYIYNGIPLGDSQILREIDYAMRFYGQPKPAVMLCYEREAFYVVDAPALRLTLDSNVRYRTTELTPKAGLDGKCILPQDKDFILEFKTDAAMPLWLAQAFEQCKIYPSSFSKYANAYRDLLKQSEIQFKGDSRYGEYRYRV